MLRVRTKLCIRLASKREIDEGGGKKKDKKLKTITEFLDDFLAKFWNFNTYFKYTISFFSVILLYKFIH